MKYDHPDFRVGDLLTAAATNHAIIYKVVKVCMNEMMEPRIIVSIENGDGRIHELNGYFSPSTFTRYATPARITKEDVTYYEAITEGLKDENEIQS